MLATQKGRSKPSRISWSRWLKLMRPPSDARRDDSRARGTPPMFSYEWQIQDLQVRSLQERQGKDLVASDGSRVASEESQWDPPPMFFISVDSKEFQAL